MVGPQKAMKDWEAELLFHLIPQWTGTASVDFSLGHLIQVMVLLGTGGANGGGYMASKYVLLAIYAAILVVHGLINSLPIQRLYWLGKLGVFWNTSGVIVLVILIPAVSKERAATEFIFTHFNTDNGVGIRDRAYIFAMGLLMSQYSLLGYDTSAHMTEETKNADRSGPMGIVASVALASVFGWVYLVALTSAVTDDIPYLLDAGIDAGGYAVAQALYDAFRRRLGSGVGGIVCMGIVAVAVFICGSTNVTSDSRMAYAFSRDGAMPFSRVWHRVNRHEVPFNAVWFSVAFAFVIGLPSLGSQVAFQPRRWESFVPGPFHLGPRCSLVVGWVAVAWVALLTVLFSLPVAYPVAEANFNYTPVAVGGVLVLSVGAWLLHARFWFHGPVTNVAAG
ncbi:hypothetical protein PVAP13_2NG080000 [Panicum virgatum]|uniref:Uncharacterized protein n=1 Tax=Panicum virgatum TaxID=38727 RepID=A0A8T0VN70_PANVG|nr:hypothetical protein PVAP13_2NG080000 [Panicum virgatum]